MIMYTMVPHEMIFPEDDSHYSQYKTIPIEHGHVIVQQISTDECMIVRLVCSNPMAYLQEHYTPGTIVKAGLLH
ncbi:YlzJ-like family protein [Alkalihalobacillus pseudalcaliphilus]|uniref:YlzJ-like family protein n=1 Tax=Alkalihalobacillus pseudalcaliphilus TaxID=79884 RepID=UPI00064E0096|nr:YlzJ-like family protein [Alkalihalobacillus pseudalcaliphilus]KMK77272.1 hypothetical protein AB990_06920 [Alkalihalobacillus pseudalcaliphilus]